MLTGFLPLSLALSNSLSLHKQGENYFENLCGFAEGEMRSNIESIEMLHLEFYFHHSHALSAGATLVVLLILSLPSIDQSKPNMDTLLNHRSRQNLINAPET